MLHERQVQLRNGDRNDGALWLRKDATLAPLD